MPQILYNLACDGFLLDAAFVVKPKHATFKGALPQTAFLSIQLPNLCELP